MVKKVILAALVLCSTLSAEIKFKKYDEALKEAQKDNKLIALTVVSTNCPWCHKLQKETLSNKDIQAMINKDFVYVVINKDTTQLPAGINARLVPTTYFLDKNGQKLTPPAIGYWEPEEFQEYIKDALKKVKK